MQRLAEYIKHSRLFSWFLQNKNRKLLEVTLVLHALSLLILGALLLHSPTSPMVVQAITEVWSINLGKGDSFPDYLSGPVITSSDVQDFCKQVDISKPQTVNVDFQKITPVSIRIEFVSIDSHRLSVTFRPISDTTDSTYQVHNIPYATISCGGQIRQLKGNVGLVYSVQGTVRRTFIAHGLVTIGTLPKGYSTSGSRMLLSGEIVATAPSFPSSTGRVEARSPLSMGEEVQFFDSIQGGSEVQSDIIATYESDQKAFRLVVYSQAGRADVKQIGASSSYPIINAPPLWARIQAQSQWAVCLVMGWIFLNAINVYRHYRIVECLRRASGPHDPSDLIDIT